MSQHCGFLKSAFLSASQAGVQWCNHSLLQPRTPELKLELQMEYCCISQADLELLASRNSPASDLQSTGIIDLMVYDFVYTSCLMYYYKSRTFHAQWLKRSRRTECEHETHVAPPWKMHGTSMEQASPVEDAWGMEQAPLGVSLQQRAELSALRLLQVESSNSCTNLLNSKELKKKTNGLRKKREIPQFQPAIESRGQGYDSMLDSRDGPGVKEGHLQPAVGFTMTHCT
ncbi:hypothetical protein AAY473_011478 [Plecturocebus cupreus]